MASLSVILALLRDDPSDVVSEEGDGGPVVPASEDGVPVPDREGAVSPAADMYGDDADDATCESCAGEGNRYSLGGARVGSCMGGRLVISA